MPVNTLIKISQKLDVFCQFVGTRGSYFIMPLVFVTIWDVIVRKLGGIQYWLITNLGSVFESTKIQEWEWHFHTALFALVLGYGYMNNRHVRVDLIRENLSFRKQTWIEFLGCTFFMIPFTLVVGYFAIEFAWSSFEVGEISASTVGLSHRWIIKSILAFGLLVAAVSGFAVWLQTVLVLFTPEEALRDPALNQETSEHFATRDFLRDPDGRVTGKAKNTYVSVKKMPVNLEGISVSDVNGSVTFTWTPDSGIIYFSSEPKEAITVTYAHRFQLYTLEWPEVQAIRGARTRQN